MQTQSTIRASISLKSSVILCIDSGFPGRDSNEIEVDVKGPTWNRAKHLCVPPCPLQAKASLLTCSATPKLGDRLRESQEYVFMRKAHVLYFLYQSRSCTILTASTACPWGLCQPQEP